MPRPAHLAARGPSSSEHGHRLDVIGDVHGQLEALTALGRHLGYDPTRGWHHPDGRVLVFLGDLIDRGSESLEVCELVKGLVEQKRAVCLMGNHEYNLVSWQLKLMNPRKSNLCTTADVAQRADRWAPVLSWLAKLPIAIELPALRMIHAVWHPEHVRSVSRALRRTPGAERTREPTASWVARHAVLQSPFDGGRIRRELPAELVRPGNDRAHEVLVKGYEALAPRPFHDADGHRRERLRVSWWNELEPDPISTIFGHYWNLPPVVNRHTSFVPPFPSGHPTLAAWHRELAPEVQALGAVRVPTSEQRICIDYNGIAGCLGAFRWPEREVWWARVGIP